MWKKMLDRVRVMGRMEAQGVVPLHFWINSRAGESLRGCFFCKKVLDFVRGVGRMRA